MYICTQSCIK